MLAIKTENLTKEFNGLVAVDKVSLEIKEGELFGLLGPNGAGKTTILKMLSTLLKPTSGYGEISGNSILKDQDSVRRSIGIVFQDPSVDSELTGRENLDFHARMYGMDKKLRDERIKEVLSLVELTDKENILLKNYSGGMQRRLEIARGLMHRPKVLFLDEPTLGLDTQTRRRIWEYIKMLNKEERVTMILTTHYMEEADYLCDRVAIIDHGKIVALDTAENLKNSIGADVIKLEIANDGNEKFISELEKCDFIKKIIKHDSFLDLSVENGETKIPEIIGIAQKSQVVIKSVSLRKPTLEDVFLHFTGKTIREKEARLKDNIKRRVQMRIARR